MDSDPSTFIYDLYMRVEGIPRHADVRIGRQFVYSGVGSTLLDGVRARYAPSKRFRTEMFSGSSVSRLDPERVRSYSDFNVWGGRISYLLNPDFRVGLGLMRRETDGNVSNQTAGLQGEYYTRKWTGFGRVSYNALNRRLSEILARLSTSPDNWYLSGEFDWREPSVPGNSLFSIVDFTAYRTVRLEATRKLHNGLRLTSRILLTAFENDQTVSASVGVTTSAFSIGYRHQSGFGGNNDGIFGSANMRLNHLWDIYANADLNRYRVQAEQLDKSAFA